MESVHIEIINTVSLLYKKTVDLREEVLRIPIGMTIKNDDLRDDVNQIHFVALLKTELVGIVVLKIGGEIGILRQMAVKPELHGKQIGSMLVQALETHAKSLGLRKIELHARHYAVGFYEKLNYVKNSIPVFQEVGMDHYEMIKMFL